METSPYIVVPSMDKKLVVPNVYDYKCVYEYLHQFYRDNKKQHYFFSYRYLAKKLNWPNTYFSDFLARRRKINLAQTFQFAKLLEMEPKQIDFLMTLVLTEQRDIELKHYFFQKLESLGS